MRQRPQIRAGLRRDNMRQRMRRVWGVRVLVLALLAIAALWVSARVQSGAPQMWQSWFQQDTGGIPENMASIAAITADGQGGLAQVDTYTSAGKSRLQFARNLSTMDFPVFAPILPDAEIVDSVIDSQILADVGAVDPSHAAPMARQKQAQVIFISMLPMNEVRAFYRQKAMAHGLLNVSQAQIDGGLMLTASAENGDEMMVKVSEAQHNGRAVRRIELSWRDISGQTAP